MNDGQNKSHASNACIIANMIDLGVEVMMRIDPDYICVEQNSEAKDALADALGAHILNNIVKTAGV